MVEAPGAEVEPSVAVGRASDEGGKLSSEAPALVASGSMGGSRASTTTGEPARDIRQDVHKRALLLSVLAVSAALIRAEYVRASIP